MRIGLNLLYLIPNVVGGTETYAVSLIKSLTEIDKKNEYFIFLNQESSKLKLAEAPNFHKVICKINATNRLKRYLWEQLILPFKLYSYKIELVHSLGYVGPIITPCKAVISLPDLNYISLKHIMPLKKQIFLKLFSIFSNRWANHIITISYFSKEEIKRILKIASDKITVTHLGPREIDNCNTNFVQSWDDLKKTYGIKMPYIVAFGGNSVHKNISGLINAFSLIKNEFPHSLVLLGHMPPNINISSELKKEGMHGRIIATGYVPSEHIEPLLAHAELFIFPSLYEGFGIPLIEAQKVNTAVASSNAASLPEIGGNGAYYFDPTSIEAIANSIKHCLSDSNVRISLISNGKENLKRFYWEKTARETLEVYQNIYNL